MTDLAQSMIEYFEDLKLTAYKDTRGFWTIGYGHLLSQDHDWSGYAIDQAAADAWLDQDMTEARADAAQFPHFSDMNDVRQAVCVSMCFQMGTKPLSWPKFNEALKAQDYITASKAGLDSEWAREETPERASLEMAMLNSGVWELPT
jgi:lysozyme